MQKIKKEYIMKNTKLKKGGIYKQMLNVLSELDRKDGLADFTEWTNYIQNRYLKEMSSNIEIDGIDDHIFSLTDIIIDSNNINFHMENEFENKIFSIPLNKIIRYSCKTFENDPFYISELGYEYIELLLCNDELIRINFYSPITDDKIFDL